MCGIIFFAGAGAMSRVHDGLERLRHRGPDDSHFWAGDGVALGFARLAINGSEALGRQPYVHGDLVGAINGEIYNHAEIAASHSLEPGPCDAHVVLPLVERIGRRTIDVLDGFYAGVVFRRSTREVLCLRDHMGKKPLFVGRSRSEIFITSELKALDEVEWFEPLPLGVSAVDVATGRSERVAEHRRVAPSQTLAHLVQAAVRKRMPASEQPLGVFLSGGLDSSIIAALVARERDDVTYFTLGEPDGPDRKVVESLRGTLGLKDVRFIPLPASARVPELVERVVYATESYNPSIVSNGLATFLLAEAAHASGVKVVMTGEGADELFGGYHNFGPGEEWREIRERLVVDMHLTELRRLDMTSMAHGVEARCPFLDRAVRGFSDGLGYDDLYHGGENKVVLRRGFEGLLPGEVLWRRKTSFDVGSEIRGVVVQHLRAGSRSEREGLRRIWGRLFTFDASRPYFHAYPAFDAVIDRRGARHR